MSRSILGFVVSLIAGIMIIINAAALLSASFYALWAGIFPWITYFGAFPPWPLVAIGLILGIVVAIGSILMVLGYGTVGAIVVFPAAVISLILGGGFLAGFILGVVGGILGMLGRLQSRLKTSRIVGMKETKICLGCRAEVDRKSKFCPECGRMLTEETRIW